jgi:hypothetical protein
MVMISPQITTTKPAPADRRTSRTGNAMAGRRAAQVRIGREGILRLGHADRQVAVALRLPRPSADRGPSCRRSPRRRGRSLGDRLDLLEQRHLVGIERRELRLAAFGELDDLVASSSMPSRALGPVLAQDRLGALLGHIVLDRLDLGVGVGDEMVDRRPRPARRTASRSRCGGRGWRSPSSPPRRSPRRDRSLATPPFIFIARTVATITTASGAGPPCGT